MVTHRHIDYFIAWATFPAILILMIKCSNIFKKGTLYKICLFLSNAKITQLKNC